MLYYSQVIVEMETLNLSRLGLTAPEDKPASPNKSKQSTKTTKEPDLLDVDGDADSGYSDDIWKNMVEQDVKKPKIHFQSPQIKFRGSLVRYVRDSARRLSLHVGTTHAAVALLDRFMDAHTLREDRLTHVALACLSLAAKSEEKYSQAPSVKTLAKVSGIQLCGRTFTQLEWMVGEHVNWRLLAPTAVSFAALLAPNLVADEELATTRPEFVKRYRRDGARLLEDYLDLTLADVRLKAVDSVDIACACAACARADLGLVAWPGWLAGRAKRNQFTIGAIFHLLQRMMQLKKSTDTSNGGVKRYITSPPVFATSPIPPASPPDKRSERNNPCSVLDLESTSTGEPVNVESYCRLPKEPHQAERVDDASHYTYARSAWRAGGRLDQPPTSVSVKRSLPPSEDVDRKRPHTDTMELAT